MRAAWRRSYLLFAVFLAFAALFGVQAFPVLWTGRNLVATAAALAVVLAAVAVLCAPGQPWRLLVLVQLTVVGRELIPSVWVLTGLVNLTVVLSIVRQALRRRGRPLDGAALMAELAPALRLGTVLFYGFSFLWMLRQRFMQPGMQPDFTNVALVIEGLAPLLLLLPVTRAWAALGLLAFHAVTGLNAGDQQSLGLAATIFVLLLPALSPGQMQSLAANQSVRWVRRWLAPAGRWSGRRCCSS